MNNSVLLLCLFGGAILGSILGGAWTSQGYRRVGGLTLVLAVAAAWIGLILMAVQASPFCAPSIMSCVAGAGTLKTNTMVVSGAIWTSACFFVWLIAPLFKRRNNS